MAHNFDPIRALEEAFNSAAPLRNATGLPMDLYRDGETFVALFDLPGVDPQSIDIDVEDRNLTIRAQRSNELADGAKWLTRERPAGTFARQLSLGSGVAVGKIDAKYADGVLTLTIPVAEEAKPRKISVQHNLATTEIYGEASEAH